MLSLTAVNSLQASFVSSRRSSLIWDPLWHQQHRLLSPTVGSFSRQHVRASSPSQLLIAASMHRKDGHLPLPQHQPSSDTSLSKQASFLVMKALKALQKPVMVALLIGVLFTHTVDAWAASGGMVGGRAFSSRRSSAPSSSRTYTAPRTSFSFSAPYVAPSPFFGGFGPSVYVGPAYGIGIGGGGSFLLFVLGLMAVFMVTGFLSERMDSGVLTASQKTTVMKLQVGLLGMARTLQSDLDRLAVRADTSTPQGLHFLLTETVLALLRHPDYWISGNSLSDRKRSSEAGEQRFNELSLEERGKFDEETLVNVDSIHKRISRQRINSFNNEYIVVTLLVAAEGDHKLPAVNSNNDLKEALRKLGSIPTDQLLAVEVLWTPQDENDTLSERELLRDYPLLKPL